MTSAADLFVQAFWVRCRETIRPELDAAVQQLKSLGHDAHVGTQEFSEEPDGLPDAGPALILSVHPHHAAGRQTLRFRGDAALGDVVVSASTGHSGRHTLDSLELPVVRAAIAAFVAALPGARA